jgi:hypothetical protein
MADAVATELVDVGPALRTPQEAAAFIQRLNDHLVTPSPSTELLDHWVALAEKGVKWAEYEATVAEALRQRNALPEEDSDARAVWNEWLAKATKAISDLQDASNAREQKLAKNEFTHVCLRC